MFGALKDGFKQFAQDALKEVTPADSSEPFLAFLRAFLFFCILRIFLPPRHSPNNEPKTHPDPSLAHPTSHPSSLGTFSPSGCDQGDALIKDTAKETVGVAQKVNQTLNEAKGKFDEVTEKIAKGDVLTDVVGPEDDEGEEDSADGHGEASGSSKKSMAQRDEIPTHNAHVPNSDQTLVDTSISAVAATATATATATETEGLRRLRVLWFFWRRRATRERLREGRRGPI